LKNNNYLAFIFTSYLKSVAAGPHAAVATNCKKAKQGQSGGIKRLLCFLKKVPLLCPGFNVFKVPKRGSSKEKISLLNR
jgi:hypothetical protein